MAGEQCRVIEAICDKVLDILEADTSLYAGGNAYAAGWTGVLRPDVTGSPAAGYVNLFDKAYDDDGSKHRPAVYVGTRAMEATDSLDYESQSSGGRIEYRVLVFPLIVAVQAADKFSARKQRNQLVHNIKQILLQHILADGFWYELTIPGNAGGGALSHRVWLSASGGNSQQVAEAMSAIPLQIRYSWSVGCDA